MRPAVFLDRDGTINQEVNYLSRPEDCILIPGAGRAIARLNRAHFWVVVASNQSGLARNYFAPADLEAVNARLRELLAAHGAHIDAFYHCPHLPAEKGGIVPELAIACDCRKPAIGMLARAAREHDLSLGPGSYMVGDRARDVACGKNAGLTSILVQSGHADPPAGPAAQPDYTAPDLASAVEWILARGRAGR